MPLPDAAFLFAAGFGTRMAPLTRSVPKPLIHVAGRPLFDHALDLIHQARIDRVVANTHYLGELLSAHLSERGVIESRETQLLDTGAGLRQALPLLDATEVLTLNTDAVWTGQDIVRNLCAAWNPDRMDALLLLVPNDTATGHLGNGDFLIDAAGRLTPGAGAVYSGLQIIKTYLFETESEPVFPMHRVWKQMLAKGRLFGQMHSGGWCDVGRPECIPLAEALLADPHV